MLVGVGVLVVLLVLPRITPRIPAVLVAVVGATIVSAVLDLAADGVATVGTLPQGFPKPSLPWTSVDDVGPLLLAAIGIVLVSLTDTIATASSFAARRGDELQPNQEMIGIGAANVAAGFFQGFAVSTSGSRTAVAEQSGAKTQLTGVVGAGLVAILLLFLNSLLSDLPQSALAGVVIAAALSLANIGALRQYATVRRSSLLLSLVATLGVVALGVLQGIVVAIFLAVLLFFRRNWWPHGAVLGRTDDSEGWHSVDDLPDAARSPASSSTAGRRRCSSPTPARSASRSAAWSANDSPAGSCCSARPSPTSTSPRPRCSSSSTPSSTRAGIHLAFVELRSRLQDLVGRYGLYETLDRDHFYPTIDAALAAIADES